MGRGTGQAAPIVSSGKCFYSVFFSALATTGVCTLPLATRRWREALFDSGRGLQDTGPAGLPGAGLPGAGLPGAGLHSSRRAGLAWYLPIPSSTRLADAQAPPGGGGAPPSACRSKPRQSSLICRRLSKIEDCTPRLSIDGLLGCA
jgi:hypothetical protein